MAKLFVHDKLNFLRDLHKAYLHHLFLAAFTPTKAILIYISLIFSVPMPPNCVALTHDLISPKERSHLHSLEGIYEAYMSGGGLPRSALRVILDTR